MTRFYHTLQAILATIVVSLFTSPLASAGEPNTLFSQTDPVLAKIGTTSLSMQDIEDKQINELRSQLYELLSHKLMKAAVVTLAQTRPEYGQLPTASIKDADIKEFYNTNNLQTRGPYVQLYSMIKQYLENQLWEEHYATLYHKAVGQGLIKSYLAKPNDFFIRVPVESAFMRGNPAATVMVLEFSDYQCPFCARIQPTLTQLMERYKDRVIFGYRHAPLPFHQEADEAAVAAECARDQGKFAELHELLFENPRRLQNEHLKAYAQQVKIPDQTVFDACLDQDTYRPRLTRDQQAAVEAGIRGTPGFVIGTYDRTSGEVVGEILSGAQPESTFVQAIEKFLAQ